MDWPENRADPTPIENLWMLLKNKVSEKQPTNAKSLVTAIKDIWTKEISAEYGKMLIDSMPQRIEAVLRNRGGTLNSDILEKLLYLCVLMFFLHIQYHASMGRQFVYIWYNISEI